ncbi:type IIL restriction-modification enzyme MmeI [Brachyspira innocens]|uniref:Eco57I restriction-modification methylase domain-containing protein n=1 Tax=Brachyspira innocens TaxID=13264 RepID=UPI0026ECDBCC|nr:type IIL restriction-modification enzyme MmeI [Brachyspira innocens]
MKKNNSVKNVNTQNNNFKFDVPYNKQKWAEHFGENFKEEYGAVAGEDEIIEKNKDFLNKIIWIGDLNINENEVIGVFEVYIKNTRLASRVKISRICSRILMSGSYGKGIFFILYEDNKNNYRVSYVKHDKTGIKGENGLIIMKDDYSNPKRYTFLLGEGIKVHTPASRITSDIFGSVESIENAFSVEGVNKEFYKGVKEYFEKIHNDIIKYFDKDENKAKEFALRFLGRVLFCWFLREKELIPNEILNSGVFENLKYKKNYYSDVLEDLFFNVLNMDMEKRKFSKERVIYNYEKAIPFLNGGLFSKKEDDEAVESIDDEIIKGLFEFFEMYNFTVDESAPFDVEISIDPEMLGRIFEELLDEINPDEEKKKNNNKDNTRNITGSFYTPREIVDYIITSSIKLYLKNNAVNIPAEKIDNIFDFDKKIDFTEEEKKELFESIYNMKVLDPACGSGAFPIGVLQRILYLIEKYDEYNQYYSSHISIENGERYSYSYKLSILENNIYGVDIQPIAIEMSRLRAFLTLIIDEAKADRDLKNLGIKPLPNLDFRFICANSLKNLDFNFEDGTMGKHYFDAVKEKMNNVSKLFFSASSPEEKENSKHRFLEFQEFVKNLDFIDYVKDIKNIKEKILSWNPFENHTADFFSPLIQFGIGDNFDVIIGNPPYGAKLSEEDRKYFEKDFKLGTTNTAALFLGLMKRLLKYNGIGGYIIPKSFIYASNWGTSREVMINDLYELVDCGKVWKEVKLEQVITIFDNNYQNDSYITSIREDKEIKHIGEISKRTFKDFGFYVNAVSNEELNIAYKMNESKKVLNDYCINKLEGSYQNNLINEETKDTLKVLGGKHINRYYYPNIIKGYLEKKYIVNNKGKIKENSILVQNIVAHIMNPKPHIKIIAMPSSILNNKDKYILLNTVNQLENISNLDTKFILAILNSKLISWYVYIFIFGLAIRTMHFDNPVTSRIPMPLIDLTKKKDKDIYNKIIDLVDNIIDLNKKLNDDNNSSSDIKNELAECENHLDNLIYKIYGLSEDEIRVIEGE